MAKLLSYLFFKHLQSLRFYHDQLCAQIETLAYKTAVIALCKTWLTDNGPFDIYSISGRKPLIVKNWYNKKEEGVVFLCEKTLKILLFCRLNTLNIG